MVNRSCSDLYSYFQLITLVHLTFMVDEQHFRLQYYSYNSPGCNRFNAPVHQHMIRCRGTVRGADYSTIIMFACYSAL